jgi:hypothetical protein
MRLFVVQSDEIFYLVGVLLRQFTQFKSQIQCKHGNLSILPFNIVDALSAHRSTLTKKDWQQL